MANVVTRRGHRTLSFLFFLFVVWTLAFRRSREKTHVLARGATYRCMRLCMCRCCGGDPVKQSGFLCVSSFFHVGFALPSSSDIHAGPCAGEGEGGGGGLERQQRAEWNSASLSDVCGL